MLHRTLTIMISLAVAASMTACGNDNFSDNSDDVLSAYEPFVYAICDTQTNIILFAGYVDDF